MKKIAVWGLGNHAIKTWSTTQAVIALSSGEAEYYGCVRGGAIGLGYIGCEPGESDEDLLSAEYSIEVEGTIEECKVSLKPMYDPLNEKIRN